MKIYVLMTSVALLVGTSLGYWTGQGAARTDFAQVCADTGFVVVYDHESEAHRHFHCFELEQQRESDQTVKPEMRTFAAL
jgi:hypothetical protein